MWRFAVFGQVGRIRFAAFFIAHGHHSPEFESQ